jgi:acyl carrier protein
MKSAAADFMAGKQGEREMKELNNVDEALQWIAEIFEASPESIQPDTPREKVEAWDSLGMLALMARLDEDFSIILDEDGAAELKKIGDVLELLKVNGCLA